VLSLPNAAWYAILIIVATVYFTPRAGVVAVLIATLCFGGVVTLELTGILGFAPFVPDKQIMGGNDPYNIATVVEVTLTNMAAYAFAFYISRALRKRREEVAEANARLTELDEVKSRFLSIVSHDLRTPITSIKAFGELIYEEADDMDPDLARKFSGTIVEEADRLHRMVTDLLDLDKMEAGKMDWELTTQDISPVIVNSATVFGAAAQSKNIGLTHTIDSELPQVEADADRISQLLANLLSNAIKFTPEGGSIEIKVSVGDTNSHLQIEVSDTGPGIPPEDLENIFDRFSQTVTGKKEGGGTGLGLAIAKEVATAHNGVLTVDSIVGEGTTFTLSLPL